MITRLAVATIVTMLWAGVAAAGIIGTTGAVTIVSPPTNVVTPNDEEEGVIHLFSEQTDVTLSSDVTADMTTPYTTYDPPVGRTLGTVPMGTVVSSYYIHYDPVTVGRVDGSVTFDTPILAVIAEGDPTGGTQLTNPPGDTLSPSNVLGAVGTTYPGPTDGNAQGLEDNPDRLTLGEATLSIHFGASNPGDRVRILTAQTGTPVLCGNGALNAPEGCDDGNVAAGDGCFACEPETCFTCAGEPSTCSPITTCTNDDGCCAPGCGAANDNDCASLCTAGKVKCVIIKKKCELTCYRRAANHGLPVDSACLTACGDKFSACFARKEQSGDCYTLNDTSTIETKVDTFVAGADAALDPAPVDDLSACRAKKLKCVATYDQCVLNLLRKVIKTGNPLNNGKLAKCQAKFDGGVKGLAKGCFGKIEARNATCQTTGDTFTMEDNDNGFIGDVTCALGKCNLY